MPNTLHKLPIVLVLGLQILSAGGYQDYSGQRAQLVRQSNDNLLLEAARDQNVTLRLMGEAATVMVNDVDMLTLLRRRQRIVADRQAAARREPLSLDIVKDQFRDVKRRFTKIERRASNARNSTRRSGLNQRILRRQLQRVERVSGILRTIAFNLAKDECQSSPCKNGGICHDAYNGFQCECTAAWQGPTCEEDVNECFTLAGTDLAGCLNNGQCINTPGSYRCVCRNGFSGAHCRLRQNSCYGSGSKELCGEHGTCVQTASAAGYVCVCDQGWTWENATMTAPSASPCTRDVDECAPSVNPCHDVCINLPGSYRCGPCPSGYTGDGRFCRDVDECAGEDNGGCSLQPRVACINTEGSHRCGRCPPGWRGDGRSCTAADSNSCDQEEICHPLARCEYISGTVVCTCALGSFGHGYGADGCTKDPSREPCDQHPCQNNGTCVQNGRGTTCICQPGYTGAVCNSSDVCHPTPCLNGGSCRLLPGNQYQCHCPAGFTGTRCAHQRFFCGSTIRGPAGQLHFPPNSAEGEYQADERCPFIIRTSPGQVLNLTFTQFELQESTDCSADFLQLHDGNSLAARMIGRFCGSRLPLGNGSVITTQEQAFFWFRSDNETQGKGFHVVWNSLPFSCGETLGNLTLGQAGILRSPGYPGLARPGLDCRWQLTSPFGSRLVLRFYDITLGSSDSAAVNCTQDSVTVYDSDRQLLRACKSLKPEPVYSSSSSVHLELHTDSLRSDSSFQMHYEVVPGQPGCGGVFTEPRGHISGHMNAEVCLYLIEQPELTQVRLVLDEVNLLQSVNCRFQKIEIFDGDSTEAPLMQRLCGQPEASELAPLISARNKVLVRYEYALSGLVLRKSFDLSYSRVCSGTFSGQAGVITTPNYPRYLDDMTCTYNITVNDGAIEIRIIDLSLGTASDERESPYLDVYLGRDEKRHIVKSTQDLQLVSHYNRASLVFRGSSSGRGMRVEYRAVSSASGCGGFLTKPGVSQLRRLREGFCQWYIDTPGRKRITTTSLANYAVAQIYDNSTSPGILLNSYTSSFVDDFDGDFLTINFIKTGTYGIILIKFEIIKTGDTQKSLSDLESFGKVSKKCGGTFTNLFGYIKSPNWPKQYGESENCEWIIRAPLGHRLELVVQNFTLEGAFDVGNCVTDWLEIRNGDSESSPLIGRYCHDRIPPRLPSFGNVLHLKFHSDDSVETQGFLLTWQQIGAGCGGKLTSKSGAIHSPHLLAGNRGVLACDWQIVVAEGSRVRLQLESRDERLCLGQLSLFDGPTTARRPLMLRCNGTRAEPLLSTGNRVLVRYDVSSAYPDGTDFVLNYQTECKVLLERPQGAIESPNFPEKYPPMTNCEWDIRAGGRTNRLQLVFSHLSVERNRIGSTDCPFDHVTLKDMQDDLELSEQRLCTNEGIAPITSAGNRLLLRFKSDMSDQEQGFRAEYKRLGCGEHLFAAGGRFESPKAPFSVDMDCDWVITASEGMQVRLLLHELHFEAPQRECGQSDVLTVSAPGGFNSSVELYRSCREETQTQTFTSPGNELRLRFVGSSARTRKFFRASYVQVPASCGGYMSASSGVLTSPGFHDVPDSSNVANFSTNVECVWIVEVSESYGIRLWFEQVNLTDSLNCSVSFVELTKLQADGTEEFLERACGDGPPLIRMAHGQKLRVRFKAQAGSWGRFAMHYERQCGGPLAAGEGYLRSRLDEECSWLVTLPPGSKLSLRINHLECPKDSLGTQKSPNGVQILNDDDQVLLAKMCPDHPANLVVSASNVRILAKGVLLEAQYGNLENTCGGNITSPRGSLSSPNYPASYPANVECVWRVEARSGNALEVNFEAMDIVRSEHCNEDFLELRSGVQGPLLGLYCSKEVPDSPMVVPSQLWIKFRSKPGNTAGGFQLRWSYVHNMEITQKSNGTIESPPLVGGDDQPFTWRIFTEREKVIVLRFEEYISGLALFDGYDGNALAVAIEGSPWTFTSSSNVIFLKTLNADLSSFRLTWQTLGSHLVQGNQTLTTSNCTKVYTMAPGSREVVRSEGYPGEYPPNLNCEWTFKPQDPSQHIATLTYAADLEDFAECAADYVNIQSSPDLSHWTDEIRICTKDHLHPKIHGTPNLRIEFRSDISIAGKGFQGVVHTQCGSNMTGTVGTIPVQTKLADCAWHIEVRPGRQIDISIDYVGPAGDQMFCLYYGLIHDGFDDHAPLLDHGKFCNQQGFRKTSFRTSGSHAYVKYVVRAPSSPLQLAKNLWTLTYREFSECDGEIQLTPQAPSFMITSPGYPHLPHPYADCTWLVMAPPGETIAANFEDSFELSPRHCDQEYVELLDGSTKMATRLVRTCRKPVRTQRSSGNLLLVHYTSQLNEPHGGFRLNVSLSTCGGQFSSTSDSISSEHYPTLGGYPKPSECVYRIRLPKNMYIQLNITDLHLPFDVNGTSSKSTSDRLEILDMANAKRELMILDGSTVTPLVVTLNTNDAAIRFVAIQNVNNFRGFRLEYNRSVGGCSRDVTGASGNLEIPPMPPSTWLRFCRWTINVPKGQRVRLKLLNLAEVRPSSQWSNDTARSARERSRFTSMPHFSFYNDANSLSKITEFRLEGYNGSGIFESTDNFMLVTVMSNQLDLSVTPLKARYSSSEPSVCPPDIGDQASGSLSIQSLAQLADYHCSVQFVATPGTTLTFKVEEYLFQTIGGPAVVFRDDVLRTSIQAMFANVTNSYVSSATTAGRVTLLKSRFVKLQRFRATYRRHQCGGQLKAAEGLVIQSPDQLASIDDNYGEVECLWTLSGSVGYVLEGNVTLADSCDREYLVIFSGVREVSRICRGMTMNGTLLERPNSKIIYHADRRVVRQGTSFTLQLRGSMSSGNVIRLDQRPSPPVTIGSTDYVNNMERVWEFATREGLSQTIHFQDRFFIETSPYCDNDRLSVERYDRDTASFVEMHSLCGRQVPADILIPASRMRVIFRTNDNVTGDGFSFTVSPSCDVTLVALANLHKIGSPSWTAARGQKLNCSYEFLAASNHQLAVSVKTRGHSWPAIICSKSYFEVYRGGSRDQKEEESMGRLCPEFEVNGRGRLRLQFVSTASRWFELHYQLIGCGGNHTEPFSLRPPQDDEDSGRYAHNLKCQWRVTAPPQHAIVLEFKYFDMEKAETCHFDSLSIYRGATATPEHLQSQLCGNQTDPPTIMVDNNEALIVLTTDSSNSYKGFLASVRFTPNCNEQVALDLSVPRMNLMRTFRMNASETLLCNFRANAPPDHRLSLEMRKLQLNDASCPACNYVDIRDSKAVESQSLGRYRALGMNRTKVFSSYADMVIQLSATATMARNISFELILQMESTVCGETEYDMRLNESISLGLRYDNTTRDYEGSMQCSWTIKSVEDVEIDLKYLNLTEVSQRTGKCEDYLRLSMSTPYSTSFSQDFCGHYNQSFKLIKAVGSHKKIDVTFHSSALTEFRGFEIVFRRKPTCNRTYTELSQMIEADSLSNCTEYIRVPEGYSITLHIMGLYFDTVTTNYFNVTDLKTNKTILSKIHTQWSTESRITTTNELRLDSLGVVQLRFFYFSTSNAFPAGCGGELTVDGSMGSHLGNPPYEGRNSSLCSWSVSVPPGGSLQFSFSEFNMGSENNCNLDNIRFYAANAVQVVPVKTLCGSTMPEAFTIWQNNVIIVAKKSPNFNGLGFQLDINHVAA